MKAIRREVEKQYKERRRTGVEKKMSLPKLRILMAKTLDSAWKELCESDMMRSLFASVGLSLNIDGSQDDQMNFQSQDKGKPADIII